MNHGQGFLPLAQVIRLKGALGLKGALEETPRKEMGIAGA